MLTSSEVMPVLKRIHFIVAIRMSDLKRIDQSMLFNDDRNVDAHFAMLLHSNQCHVELTKRIPHGSRSHPRSIASATYLRNTSGYNWSQKLPHGFYVSDLFEVGPCGGDFFASENRLRLRNFSFSTPTPAPIPKKKIFRLRHRLRFQKAFPSESDSNSEKLRNYLSKITVRRHLMRFSTKMEDAQNSKLTNEWKTNDILPQCRKFSFHSITQSPDMSTNFLTRNQIEKLINENHQSTRFVQRKKKWFTLIDDNNLIRRFDVYGGKTATAWWWG